ncbi:MAG TPA: hypothetical protein VH394_27700 [Thermoanaerobaculia bacterium]|nr:hypothetical protein [Thermoanaerobaculia bacterium]
MAAIPWQQEVFYPESDGRQDHSTVIEISNLVREMTEGYEAEARDSSLDSEWAEVEPEGL